MKAGIILLVGLLIGIGIRILFQIPGAVLNLLIPDNFFIMTLNDALQVMAEALATTYVAIAMILYYYDIRIRREGFDLKMMAQGL
jgi:adenosine/AMP kinase